MSMQYQQLANANKDLQAQVSSISGKLAALNEERDNLTTKLAEERQAKEDLTSTITEVGNIILCHRLIFCCRG